jgi:predicted ATPase/DNA-binding XRE family transcriptional regulator
MDHEAFFGRWLQKRRRSLDLTQEMLAQRVGCSAATIRKIEAEERRPSKEVAEKLAVVLQIEEAERSTFLRFSRGGWSDQPLIPPPVAPLPSEPWGSPNNLPAQLSSFIGREEELATACALLRRAEVRLLTLSGPGGVGKTRLSLEIAATLLTDFEHGIFLVSLAALRDPELVPSTVVQALGLRESGGGSLAETLKEHLRDKHLLLILDNFEQIIAATPFLVELLTTCPQLKMLVTSRETLRVRGEYVFPVPPLPIPARTDLTFIKTAGWERFAALRLFVQRAQEVKPDFIVSDKDAAAIAAISKRLDGLPLAIELAAARISLLPPEAILARLMDRLKLLTSGARDAPARQQTMREAIAWSYDLLDEDKQALFCQLSVFAGGITLEAAAAVCRVETDVLEGIASLVNKSLLKQDAQTGEFRFLMLETLREYGFEQLVKRGEEGALRQRHAEYFVALTARAEPELWGPEQDIWTERLEREHDNLRAVLSWALEGGDVELALRLAWNISWRFWGVRGYDSEGRKWLEALLSKEADTATSVRARGALGAARLAGHQGDDERARLLFEESLALSRKVQNKVDIARALLGMSWMNSRKGDYTTERRQADEALAIARELDNKPEIAVALNHLGEHERFLGDYERAGAFYRECLTLARELADKALTALVLSNLGFVELALNNISESAELFKKGLILAHELRSTSRVALNLQGFARLAATQGEPERAVCLMAAAEVLGRAINSALDPVDQAEVDHTLALTRSQLDETAWNAAWEWGSGMAMDETVSFALRS